MTSSIRGYVTVLVLLACPMAGLLLLRAAGEPLLSGQLAVLAVVALGTGFAAIRFVHHGEVQAFTLEGGAVVALLLSGHAPIVPALMICVNLFAHGVRSRSLVKTVFNAARSGVETSVAVGVFMVVAPATPRVTDLMSLVGALAAVVVFEITSLFLTTELMARLGQVVRWRAFRGVRGLWGVNVVGTVGYGIVLAAVVEVALWIGVLAGSMMLVMYLGYRGYAAALSGERRAQALNEMTHVLIDLPAGNERIGDVLQRLVDVFGADRGELVIESDAGTLQWRVRGDEVESALLASPPRSGLLATAMSKEYGLVEVEGEEASEAVAAPIRRQGEPVGAVVVSGRRGVEPWGDADASLLAAVANELAVAFDNVALLEQVEEERQLLQAETTKLNNILGAATDGIVSVLADGTIDSWNPGMTRITGVESEDAIGRPWHAVLRLKDGTDRDIAPSGDLTSIALEDEFGASLAFQVLRVDGEWRRLQCTASPVLEPGGGRRGTVLVARDVTAEHEVEELKSDFIATVSHELRTPLTPLKGFLTTLKHAGATLSDEQRETVFRSMGSQLSRLEALIADLLTVAELDRGQQDLHTGPVQLAQLVPHAVDGEAGAQRDRCTIDVEEVIAQADAVAIVRIVRSLVSNALKHTDGPVHVLVDGDHEWARIAVVDEGPGIPRWNQQRIFGHFDRLGNHLHRTQGPGLGLTIARSLARRMGGDIALESELGEGTTFTLTVPVARPRLVGQPEVSRPAGA